MQKKFQDKAKEIAQYIEISQQQIKQAQLKWQAAQADYITAKQAFEVWIATKNATQQTSQDARLVARTQQLEILKMKENQQVFIL